MIRAAAILSVCVLTSACSGGSEAPTKVPEGPAPRALTEAEKTAVFAGLPQPWAQADLDNGRRAAARCRSCHTFTPGGPDMTGPNLNGMFGRQAGGKAGYAYSKALKEAGFAWDGERLDQWLQSPRQFLPGNKMSFPGVPDATDRRDLIAWLMVETAGPPAS